MSLNAKAIVLAAKQAVEDKKGVEPVVLDVRHLTDFTQYFLIVHGTSDRHVRTIADHIVDKLREAKIKPHHVEGISSARWVLIDYGDVIIHVFYHQTRGFYNLERLWGEAKVVRGKGKNERRRKKSD